MAEAIATALTIINLLGSLEFADDLPWMARAMEGETGGVFSNVDQIEATIWIAHTILNRLGSQGFGRTEDGEQRSMEDVVRRGFYGHFNAPDPDRKWYILAATVIFNRGFHKVDPTRGCLAMLSFHDMERMGVKQSQATKCIKGYGRYGLCFFEEWPIDD
jgi:hypothetical protein